MQMALSPYLNEELMQKRMLASDDLLRMPPGITARSCKFTATIMTTNELATIMTTNIVRPSTQSL